jgi:hypothetical protein
VMPTSLLPFETPGNTLDDSQATIPKTKTAKNPAPLGNLRSTAQHRSPEASQNENPKVTLLRQGDDLRRQLARVVCV